MTATEASHHWAERTTTEQRMRGMRRILSQVKQTPQQPPGGRHICVKVSNKEKISPGVLERFYPKMFDSKPHKQGDEIRALVKNTREHVQIWNIILRTDETKINGGKRRAWRDEKELLVIWGAPLHLMPWAWTSADRAGFLLFIDDVTVNESSGIRCTGWRHLLTSSQMLISSAHMQLLEQNNDNLI